MIDFQALRNKILDKAIRGELVPQLETEPAVENFADEPEDIRQLYFRVERFLQVMSIQMEI